MDFWKGVLALPLREGSLRFDSEPRPHHSAYFSPSCYLSIYCSGRIVVAALYCRIHAVTYGRIDTTTYGCIDVTPATQLLSNLQLCFVGTVASTGRPGWSNNRYFRGRHARALVKALADRLLGFWPRCPQSVGLSREPFVGLGSTWLGSAPNTWLRFWSACPPSVCPAPECLSVLCFEILDRGRHVPAPSGRDVGSNAWAPTREPVQGTDPRNGFLLCRYPHGVLRRSLRRLVRCQAAHGRYDVLGGSRW